MTINEALIFTGKSYSTIYRYIKNGKLPYTKIRLNGSEIIDLKENDLTRIFRNETQVKLNRVSTETQVNFSETQLTKDNLKETFNEFLNEQKTQLMKPLEEQALFIAGKYQSENHFLKERLETLRHENELLREQIKVLPGPVEEVTEKLHEQEERILILRKNKEELEVRQEQVTRQLQEQEKKLLTLELEKDEQKKELEVRQEQAMKEQEARLKAEAEEQIKQVAEAWKKELEQARRPWWKLW